jgi:M6 family metalloprotease-like protein
MNPFRLLRKCALLALFSNEMITCAVTPIDFGYERMRINGNLAIGARPIVIILMDYGNGTNTHPRQYYWELVFNPLAGNPDMSGFFQENSNGRFQFDVARSTMVGPIRLTPTELQEAMANDIVKAGHCLGATVRAGFDFSVFDANRDGRISQEELTILIVENLLDRKGQPYDSGAARWAHPRGEGGESFQPEGSSVTFKTKVCFVTQSVSFATLCHEVAHVLGDPSPWDLYGAPDGNGSEDLCGNLTLMGATITTPDNPETYHLDPWHKMQLGWSEPRIYSLTAGGYAEIPAAQMSNPHAPILLYDPARGTGEFFMLEYRTRTSLRVPSYDANVADIGMVIWHIQQDGSRDPVLIPRVDAGPLPAQPLWRFCKKCNGLHYISNATTPSFGLCPQSGAHVASDDEYVSIPYQIVMNNGNAPGQHGWRWCRKCQGMFFGPGQASSRCPARDQHDGSASGDYSFVQNDSTTPGQRYWRWCQKCQGLFFGGTMQFGNDTFDVLQAGVCPASGQHDGSLSGNYAVLKEGLNRAVFTDGAPNFKRGGTTIWHAGEVTPALRWLDGSQTLVRIYVRPFNASDGSITVEWWAEYDTWVDFTWHSFELGTFLFPFDTLGEGLNAVSHGGHLYIKSGTTPETAYITKRMTIDAYGGPVTLGRSGP